MNKTYLKKNNVIHQSAKLFYYKGYKNTSVADILNECKIPKGSFYYYFKSKNDLLMTVIDHHTDNLIRFFNITVDDLSIVKLKIFFKNFFNNIELNNFQILMMKQGINCWNPIKKLNRESRFSLVH